MGYSKQTLLFLFTTFPPEVSGSAQYNWDRVRWLAKQGQYIIVVLAPECRKGSSLPTVPPDLQKQLIIETYPSQNWLLYQLNRVPTLLAAKKIKQRIEYYQPDLITVVDVERLFWFSTWHLPGKKYANDNHIPYITEYHTDYYQMSSTYPLGKLLGEIIFKHITGYLYRQFDLIVTVSAAASRSLKLLGLSDFHQIQMYGIDTSKFSPNRRNRKHLEKWLSPEQYEHKVLLFLGRLSPEKRIELLIQAFKRLLDKHQKLCLLIAGDGPVEFVNQLKHITKTIPNIHFTGFVHKEAKANLLASCDVYCSPAPYETFGLSVVEAMASGVPVVTVNSGGVSDYLIDEINAYLVIPDDLESLTNAIDKSLSRDNTVIVKQALQDTHSLSIEQCCQNLNSFYKQLLCTTTVT
ncbi:MAG: glycosyltransferase [Cyanobacteria bacterium P01_G01_bin.67]